MYNRYIMQRGADKAKQPVKTPPQKLSPPRECTPGKSREISHPGTVDSDDMLILLLLLILVADGGEDSGMLIAALAMILLI